MKKIKENADFDVGHRKPYAIDKSYKIDAFDFQSRPDMKVRNVGNYGDNAMADVSQIDYDDQPENRHRVYEDGDSMLNRLKEILEKANVSDTQMSKGVKLTQKGNQKVAAALGIAPSEVPVLLQSLSSKLKREKKTAITSLVTEKYAYERDALANVIVRDEISGKEHFVRGAEAAELLRRIENEENEQEVLASYMPLTEEDEAPSYDEEINQSWGTFNFPWKIGNKSGTGTAKYSNSGFNVIHVRDEFGDELRVAPDFKDQITDIAKDFIGRE